MNFSGLQEWLMDLTILAWTGDLDPFRAGPLTLDPVLAAPEPDGRTRMVLVITSTETPATIGSVNVGIGMWTTAMATDLRRRAAAALQNGLKVSPDEFPEVPARGPEIFDSVEFEEGPPSIRWGQPDTSLVVTFLRDRTE